MMLDDCRGLTMSHRYRFAFLALAILTLTLFTHAQATNAGSTSKTPVPVTMTECEGVNNCATWTFLGSQGNGKWPSGEEANLTVDKLDAISIVITRGDSTGSSAGLHATYTGTRHGDRVGGDFTSSWPGHWENKSGNWYATVGSQVTLPAAFHECSMDHCLTYTLENGQYTNYTNLPNQVNERRVLTVKSFNHTSVSFEEEDYGSYPLTATWKGQISSTNANMAEGELHMTSWAGRPTQNPPGRPFKLAWGPAIDSLAGNDGPQPTQRPTIVVAPVAVCIPWFFTVICG